MALIRLTLLILMLFSVGCDRTPSAEVLLNDVDFFNRSRDGKVLIVRSASDESLLHVIKGGLDDSKTPEISELRISPSYWCKSSITQNGHELYVVRMERKQQTFYVDHFSLDSMTLLRTTTVESKNRFSEYHIAQLSDRYMALICEDLSELHEYRGFCIHTIYNVLDLTTGELISEWAQLKNQRVTWVEFNPHLNQLYVSFLNIQDPDNRHAWQKWIEAWSVEPNDGRIEVNPQHLPLLDPYFRASARIYLTLSADGKFLSATDSITFGDYPYRTTVMKMENPQCQFYTTGGLPNFLTDVSSTVCIEEGKAIKKYQFLDSECEYAETVIPNVPIPKNSSIVEMNEKCMLLLEKVSDESKRLIRMKLPPPRK